MPLGDHSCRKVTTFFQDLWFMCCLFLPTLLKNDLFCDPTNVVFHFKKREGMGLELTKINFSIHIFSYCICM